MTERPHAIPQRALTRAGPLALLAAGREAFRAVPGLRGLLIKGFLLLYGLFVLVGLVALALLYRYAVGPLAAYVGGGPDPGLLAVLIVWFAQAILFAMTLLLAFVLSLALMSLWFEALAGRVARHARGSALADAPFSLTLWLGSLGRSLKDGGLLLGLSLLTLLVAFVPVVGPFLAFALAAFLMGWEVREPYLAVRAAGGDSLAELRRGTALWTLSVGTLPVLLAMVPVLGWLLLPALLVYQVAGVAWLSERGRGN